MHIFNLDVTVDATAYMYVEYLRIALEHLETTSKYSAAVYLYSYLFTLVDVKYNHTSIVEMKSAYDLWLCR